MATVSWKAELKFIPTSEELDSNPRSNLLYSFLDAKSYPLLFYRPATQQGSPSFGVQQPGPTLATLRHGINIRWCSLRYGREQVEGCSKQARTHLAVSSVLQPTPGRSMKSRLNTVCLMPRAALVRSRPSLSESSSVPLCHCIPVIPEVSSDWRREVDFQSRRAPLLHSFLANLFGQVSCPCNAGSGLKKATFIWF